jgi:NhaA family Na+:H+ antiporter
MEAKIYIISITKFLHKPVGFLILPLFALANTAIVIDPDIVETLTQHCIGIAMGLVLGKPIGIAFSFLAVTVGL